MLASVIIPIYNDVDALYACLKALGAQSLPRHEFEVIVVDNGSVPRLRLTTFASHPLEHQLRLIRCEAPGSYAARNNGVAAATGTVLLFLDADCLPDSHWMQIAVERLTSNTEHIALGGDVRFLAPTRPTAVARYQMLTGFRQRENIEQRGFSATANLAMRAATFAHVGGFNENLLSAGDREWCWRARRCGVSIAFAGEMSVSTEPRSNLRAAIVQARRVTGGRTQLQQLEKQHSVPPASLGAARGTWASVRFILSPSSGSWWHRVQILTVATIIRLARTYETLRLRIGARPERR